MSTGVQQPFPGEDRCEPGLPGAARAGAGEGTVASLPAPLRPLLPLLFRDPAGPCDLCLLSDFKRSPGGDCGFQPPGLSRHVTSQT